MQFYDLYTFNNYSAPVPAKMKVSARSHTKEQNSCSGKLMHLNSKYISIYVP